MEINELLEKEGWTIECESPLEIRHEDGAFATMESAKLIILVLIENYYKDSENANTKV